jgi:hypothetical protein
MIGAQLTSFVSLQRLVGHQSSSFARDVVQGDAWRCHWHAYVRDCQTLGSRRRCVIASTEINWFSRMKKMRNPFTTDVTGVIAPRRRAWWPTRTARGDRQE